MWRTATCHFLASFLGDIYADFVRISLHIRRVSREGFLNLAKRSLTLRDTSQKVPELAAPTEIMPRK